MSALKFDEGKSDFTLIPQKALKEVARVATLGEERYPGFNYSKEKSSRRYVAAGLRHINEYLSGEDIDEIGTHHLANAAMSILMALDNILNETVVDDRNKQYISLNATKVLKDVPEQVQKDIAKSFIRNHHDATTKRNNR